ncbi:MAG TPA: DUF6600 domain-containing protein, partial [Thermoanaerobaculia bacterium]|nr:DUF6600 domain-containing protein [Thermoanaerobaculia bacterium]
SWMYGPRGHLVWSSYEPWGWYPYHYGRWTYSGMYGWVWLPGYRYSPAWVYWAYGPSWVGWVPSGWYDCYRPYNWIWNGYHVGRTTVGVGFFGRINLVGSDLSGWTILESGTIVSTRVDRAALTLDSARARIARDGGNGIFSSSPVRFSRDDIKDPAAAVGRVSRLGLGGGTGKEGSGSLTDLTSFFRRDPELSPAVRSGLDRSNLSDAARRMTVPTPAPDRVTSQTPSSTRSLGRAVDRSGSGRTVDRGGAAPAASQPRDGAVTRSIPTGQSPTAGAGGRIQRSAPESTPRATPDRGRVVGREIGRTATPRATPSETSRAPETAPRTERGSDDSWRGRVERAEPSPAPAPSREPESPTAAPTPEKQQFDRVERDWRSRSSYGNRDQGSSGRAQAAGRDETPIPRQVIDRIGGARIVPNRDSDSPRSGESRGRISAPRDSSSPRSSEPPRASSGGRSAGSSGAPSRSSGGSVSRPSNPSPAPSSAPSRSGGGSNLRKD